MYLTKNNKAFTLMEVMVVVLLIGIVAAFALPDYTKSIQKSHERDMIMQLTTIHEANLYYRIETGNYWNAAGATLAAINTNLGINVIAPTGTTYSYTGNNTTFTASATWNGVTIQITEAALSGTNPSCATANCIML